MCKRFFCFIIPIICFVQSVFASSVTLPSISPEDLVRSLAKKNDLIVVGQLIDSYTRLGAYPRWGQDQIIITEWEIKVDVILKGEPKSSLISLIVPGGCLNEKDLCYQNDIFPKLKQGQKMLLFLNPTEDGCWYVFNTMHGFQSEREGKFRPLGLSLNEIKNIMNGGQK